MLLTCAWVLSVESHVVFWYSVFFPIVLVTVHGEVRAEYICVICADCWALSASVMDSLSKNSVQINIASLLVFVYGEPLPFQALLLPKGLFFIYSMWTDRR